MYSSESLEVPTHWRAVRFWLLSIGMGTLFIFFAWSAELGQFNPNVVHLLVGAIAALVSLPALVFLLFFMRWAVGAVDVGQRWLRLLAVQSISAGLTMAFMCAVPSSPTADSILAISATYYVAGLAAACWVYRNWLRNPTPQPLEEQSY